MIDSTETDVVDEAAVIESIVDETPIPPTPEQELRAAEQAASVELRRKAHAAALARVVAGYRELLAGLKANLEIAESGDAIARRAVALATELGTTTDARPLGHAPWRAMLIESMAGEEQTAINLPIVPNAQERAVAICKTFNEGSPLVCTGPSGAMRAEQIAEILMATFDRGEPKRRQEAADRPIREANAAAVARQRQREEELRIARAWRADRDLRRQQEARARGDVIAASNAFQEKQRNTAERQAAENAELEEFRQATMAGEVSNNSAAVAAGVF